jgi:methionyl aminopeptidase
MIYYKTQDEIELIRISSLLVSKTLAEIASYIKPGLSTHDLDIRAEAFIRDHEAVPSFKGYRGYPASLCTSVNDVVVHGIPGNYIIKEGDIVSVDCGVFKNGYHGDSAYSFLVGDVIPDYVKLAAATKVALYEGINQAVAGNRVGDISFAVQDNTERKYGYGVVRELVGHGLGRSLHEEPDVPNFGNRGKGPKLLPGLVIAIEPMINLGSKSVMQDADGWTIKTKDKKVSVHFEHTIAIRKGAADILSDFDIIEKAEIRNQYLYKAKAEVI